MLQFDVALCRARDNVAYLSALVTRQAGKVRRYKSEGTSGTRPDATAFLRSVGVYLRRWLGLGPEIKGAPPRPGSRTTVVFTQRRNLVPLAKLLCPVSANGGFRLRRIPAFLPEASFKV